MERARELLGTELAALVGESYERAYGDMVRVQQLTEMEEILTIKLAEAGPATPGSAGAVNMKQLTHSMWEGRLRGVQRNVEVWQALLRCASKALERGVGGGGGRAGATRGRQCS